MSSTTHKCFLDYMLYAELTGISPHNLMAKMVGGEIAHSVSEDNKYTVHITETEFNSALFVGGKQFAQVEIIKLFSDLSRELEKNRLGGIFMKLHDHVYGNLNGLLDNFTSGLLIAILKKFITLNSLRVAATGGAMAHTLQCKVTPSYSRLLRLSEEKLVEMGIISVEKGYGGRSTVYELKDSEIIIIINS